MMAFYLLGYAVTRMFWNHTRSSGLRLRKAYISQMAFPILNMKVKIEGKPFDGPALYVCNHRSFSDPIVISKYLNAFVIAKAEIAKYPIINKGAEATGIIWVQRTDKDSRTNARKAFVDVVKGGHNILVYPEGTISTTKNTLPFKKGTFIEAAKEGLTVVPVALEYRSKKDLWLIPNIVGQYLNAFGKWKTEAKLSFGNPMKMEDGAKLADDCEQWINAEIEKMQRGWSNMGF
tara:strand:- start:590 stop:1288 length:699 start_codon:yes stop_codon:yes gene_type:complete